MRDDNNKKPRRARVDSGQSATTNMMAAYLAITPPPDTDLSENELVIFNEVIEELPRGEWTSHMIRIAAGLARDLRAITLEQEALSREGSVVSTPSGSPARNPRCAQIGALSAAILATRRSLSLHSRAKAGLDNRALARRREIRRDHEAAAPLDDDDLIARPALN